MGVSVLQRHPTYKARFPWHLDQERHMNSDPEVFQDWFDLYKEVLQQYGIVNGDQYNMDEKGHLMGVARNIR